MRERGIAFLETALISSLLLTMLIGGIALSTFFHKSYEINHLLDKYIVDGVVAPLKIQPDGTLTINAQPLQDYVDKIVLELEQDLVSSDSDMGYQSVPPSRYLVEAGYSVVSIDGDSGAALGFIGAPLTYQRSALGNLAVPGPDLSAAATAALSLPNLAQPSGSFDPGTSTNNYLPRTVLLSARLGFDSEGGLTKFFLSTLGVDSILSDLRVITLRAVVD